MAARITSAIARSKAQGRTAFIAYITGGYPNIETTVPALLGLQAGGADVLELGIPFTDPLADGSTIQRANEVALKNGMTLAKCFDMVKTARSQGLYTPVVLMGYYNPMLQCGLTNLCQTAKDSGVDGFICVDLPPEESKPLIDACNVHGLSAIPLLAPTTLESRIKTIADQSSSFVYCVSVTGVTGQRTDLAADIGDFIGRVRKHTDKQLAVGFGISTREHVKQVGAHADAAVVGSAFIHTLTRGGEQKLTPEQNAENLRALCAELTGGPCTGEGVRDNSDQTPTNVTVAPPRPEALFGEFGGQYIPETLVDAHDDLERAWDAAKHDPEYKAELERLRREYVGGPTPLYFCERLTQHCGGANIYLKREDLCHTGAHKINNALGQALLAKRLGKHRIIAETGAGQHGVATATACALLGLECIVYMGSDDCKRQSLNVFRMNILGAKVVPVDTGSCTLKDAINEAMRDWVTNVRTTHYVIGSAIGPHPFPRIVRDLQRVIGDEAREQCLNGPMGKLPDEIVACVGGGSNAIGLFYPFVEDKDVAIVGVEAGGKDGASGEKHSATLSAGKIGVLHGTKTLLLQDDDGQISETHSISAGLDYPGVGPEHAHLKVSGRATYEVATDSEALDALQLLARMEGVICALETAHAMAYAIKRAPALGKGKNMVVNLSGRGDKDMISVARALGVSLEFL